MLGSGGHLFANKCLTHRLHKGARRLDGPAAAVIAKCRSNCRSFPTLPDSRYNIGTIDGRRKNGFPAPKRHQAKHLGFWSLPVRDQGVGGSNPLSPTILSILISITYKGHLQRTRFARSPKKSPIRKGDRIFILLRNHSW